MPEHQNTLEQVKYILTSTPLLAAPQMNKLFKLQVDASKVGVGTILLQDSDEGIERLVCCFSRKFKAYQLNYSTIEKEALALILQNSEVYVSGPLAPIVVYCDQNPLTFLHSLQNPNQRQMCWCIFL